MTYGYLVSTLPSCTHYGSISGVQKKPTGPPTQVHSQHRGHEGDTTPKTPKKKSKKKQNPGLD